MHGLKCSCDLIGKLIDIYIFMEEFVMMNFLRWTKLVLMIRFIYPLGLSCQSKSVLGLILNKFHPQSSIFNENMSTTQSKNTLIIKLAIMAVKTSTQSILRTQKHKFRNFIAVGERLAHIPEVYTSVPF